MSFQVGDRIRFRYTGMRGQITKDFLDGSYLVYDAEEDDEIVAFADDIVHEHAFKGVEKAAFSNKKNKTPKEQKQLSTEELFYSKEELERQRKEALLAPLRDKNLLPQPAINVPKKQVEKPLTQEPEKNTAPSKPIIKEQPASDKGLFIALSPEEEDGYVIYLINDSPNSFSFDFKLVVHQLPLQQLSHSITPYTFFAIGNISQSNLFESPSVDFSIPAVDFQKNIRLKGRKINESNQNAPLMGCQLPLFTVFMGKNMPSSLQSGDLKAYTQKLVDKNKPKVVIAEPPSEVERVAAFSVEIDLHFEKLVKEPSKYLPNEIVNIQVEEAEKFIESAVSMGIREIFLIHGVGNGRLRERLHQVLKKHPAVLDFNNNWHKKYGAGATWVKFG